MIDIQALSEFEISGDFLISCCIFYFDESKGIRSDYILEHELSSIEPVLEKRQVIDTHSKWITIVLDSMRIQSVQKNVSDRSTVSDFDRLSDCFL
jgi:hypothetical protein